MPTPAAASSSIEAESGQRWLMVLNDMRLALGTRLGVTADGFADESEAAIEPTGARQAARAAYHWLTARAGRAGHRHALMPAVDGGRRYPRSSC